MTGRKLTPAYARRIERGRKQGLSLSQARGHPRVGEEPLSKNGVRANNTEKLEAALKRLRALQNLQAAAKESKISPERLRRFVYGKGLVRREGRKWIDTDNRPRRVLLTSGHARYDVVVSNYAEAAAAGSYEHARGVFIRNQDREILTPFIGRGVTDIKGRFHPFETDPNSLYRLAAAGGPEFYEVYAITA